MKLGAGWKLEVIWRKVRRVMVAFVVNEWQAKRRRKSIMIIRKIGKEGRNKIPDWPK